MCVHTHLVRRKSSRSYYFRCRIPADLLEHFAPKEEIYRSLKTSDPKEALSRVKLETLKQDQEFFVVRRRLEAEPKHNLSQTEIERLAALWLHDVLEEDEEVRREGLDDKSYRQIEESLEICAAGERPMLARGDTHLMEFEVDDLLDRNGIKLDKRSDAYGDLAYALLKASVRATDWSGSLWTMAPGRISIRPRKAASS